MSNMFGTAKVFASLILFFVIGHQVNAQTTERTASIYTLPAGTRVRLRIEGEIGSGFSSVNDTFLARVAVPVKVRDVTVLGAGTLMEGRVLSVSPAGLGSRNGRIDFQMETIRFADDVTRDVDGGPVTPLKAKQPNMLWPILGGSAIGAAIGLAAASGRGALIGAGIGGATGAGGSYFRKGREVGLKDDDIFEIELRKEVVLPVRDY